MDLFTVSSELKNPEAESYVGRW